MPTTNLGLPTGTLGISEFKESYLSAIAKIDAAFGTVLTGSAVYNPASLADGAGLTTTVTVTGAALGDFVTAVSFNVDLAGMVLTGYVSAPNTVSVRFQNESGGGVLDLASGTLAVRVRKAG